MKTKDSSIKQPKSKKVKKEVQLSEEELHLLKERTLKRAKKKADKERYYVDTKVLEKSIKEYYDSNKISDSLATSLYNIAYRISFMPNFINYSWREEMIGDGLIKELVALKNHKFNPKLGKAFSYLSMIVYNSFRNRIKKENKASDVLKEFQNDQYETFFINQHMKNTCNNDEAIDD